MKLSSLGDVQELDERRDHLRNERRLLAETGKCRVVCVGGHYDHEIIDNENQHGAAVVNAIDAFYAASLAEIDARLAELGVEVDDTE